MLIYHSIPDSRIVEFTIDGSVSRKEFATLVAKVERKICDFGSVDVLEEIRSIGKVPPAVIRADLSWAIAHWKKISRAAIVCDKEWVDKLVGVIRPLVSTDARHFELEHKDLARRWLTGGFDWRR